jgi:type II secretory pathway component PulJ
MEYVAFIFALALACAAGMEFVYLRFMEAISRQQKRRIAELERRNAELERELQSMETSLDQETETDEEAWPELLDDDNAG